MNIIPAFELKRQSEMLRPELDEAVARIMAGGSYILGEEVAAFEKEFADYCHAAHAVGVASGTDALQLALMACGVGAGDEVIAPSHTAVATIAAIEMTGARPVLVDIDLTRYTIDPKQIAEAITPHTRAIIPVHLYGCPADMNPILEIARAKNIFVIEDASQAHGATVAGQRVGSLGQIAAFSFYPTKNLGAFGDGGAVVTNDSQLAEKVHLLRQYGWKERYISQVKGLNSRLDELQAGILRVKLRHLEEWNQRRRHLASLYVDLLSESDLTLPPQPADIEPVYHQFVVRHPRRDALRETLRSQGIQTLVHYPVPVHLQPAYANLGLGRGSLPKSEQAADEVLSLPLYPELTEDQVQRVAEACLGFS
ncbi:MAG TPA: DegT/DnrJ/EryC1/StrS family aminotransferase [Anaerolineales bacterium]|nr:DegT/DnrJ/EryC1/StrS family aminotransferase [Anaerolineales bacterium]